MMDYGQVLELDEVTLEDRLNLYNAKKRILIKDGKIANILEEGE